MTFLLACAALILLLTGHWGWALAVLLLLLLLSPSGKTSSGTGNTPSPKLASYAPEERHEHPAARVRRETTLVPLVRPPDRQTRTMAWTRSRSMTGLRHQM